jgi:hypothetical protein
MASPVFHWGLLLVAGAGILAMLAGAGVLLFFLLRRKKEPRGFEVLPKK